MSSNRIGITSSRRIEMISPWGLMPLRRAVEGVNGRAPWMTLSPDTQYRNRALRDALPWWKRILYREIKVNSWLTSRRIYG